MISLMIILIVGCILESTYVNNSFDNLIERLETFQLKLDSNKDNINLDDNIYESKQIHNDWHKRVDLLKCLIWHTGIKDIEVGLARISTYIEENDYTVEIYSPGGTLLERFQKRMNPFADVKLDMGKYAPGNYGVAVKSDNYAFENNVMKL